MPLLTKAIILATALICTNAAADSKKVIKWVDKNGVTQYGDRPPMPSVTKKYSVIKHGITVKKVGPEVTSAEEDKALVSQSRYDNALLASYNSTEEIEVARKRNIKIDQLALATLELRHAKLTTQLQDQNEQLLMFAKKNQPAPADIALITEKNVVDITKLESQITKHKQAVEKINARYEKDKARYTQLESRKEALSDVKYSNKNKVQIDR